MYKCKVKPTSHPSKPPAPPPTLFLSFAVSYAKISSFLLAILPLKKGLSSHLFMCGKCIKIYKINPFTSRRKLAFLPGVNFCGRVIKF